MGEFNDKPYLTRAERAKFKRLRDANVVSFFRLGACERCKAEVPMSKRFCSWDCYQQAEYEDGKDQEGEDDHGRMDR